MPSRKISVLILYNSPRPAGRHTFVESEVGVLGEVEAVHRALDDLRIPHRVIGVRRFQELPAVLSASDEPVVFNLVEAFWVDAGRANFVPTVVASFGKACTGNDTQGLLLSLDKWQSKTLFRAAGLPTPEGLIIQPGQAIPMRDLFDGPYIVKPAQADASEGIDNTSIIHNRGKALHEAVRRIHDRQAQPALIEQYIDGRELNVSVIHHKGEPQVLPLAEIDFSAFEAGQPRIVGYEAKWLEDSFEFRHTPRIIPALLPKRLTERIGDLAAASCRTLSCLDYCRVDFRLDKANRPYVLEVNANPDITLGDGFAAALEAAGISYNAFVKLTIDNALRRSSQLSVHSSQSGDGSRQLSTDNRQPTTIKIRWCQPQDRQVVLSFLAQTGFFRPDEIDIARELLDAALVEGPKGHYQSFVACVRQGSGIRDQGSGAEDAAATDPRPLTPDPSTSSETVGWVCFGPTPCTLGTFDIYWIGVAPAWQGRGIGRALTDFAEQVISERGGRLMVVETSSRETYLPTRRFYEALGYREAARITDFYGPGDHKVILLKAGKVDGRE
jgi:D-alanine-D-alanine ligase